MDAVWRWLNEENGWWVVFGVPWLCLCAAIPVIAIWVFVNAMIEAVRGQRVRYISEEMLTARYRRGIKREWEEMEGRGKIVWRPSPLIESTRSGFREPEIQGARAFLAAFADAGAAEFRRARASRSGTGRRSQGCSPM